MLCFYKRSSHHISVFYRWEQAVTLLFQVRNNPQFLKTETRKVSSVLFCLPCQNLRPFVGLKRIKWRRKHLNYFLCFDIRIYFDANYACEKLACLMVSFFFFSAFWKTDSKGSQKSAIGKSFLKYLHSKSLKNSECDYETFN